MEDLLKYLSKNIISFPKKLIIKKEEKEGITNLYLTADAQDLGKIIGKNGKTIKALRTILHLKSLLIKKRVGLFVNEEGEPEKNL